MSGSPRQESKIPKIHSKTRPGVVSELHSVYSCVRIIWERKTENVQHTTDGREFGSPKLGISGIQDAEGREETMQERV